MFSSARLRSESGLRLLTSSLRVWGVWAALAVACSAPVLADDNEPKTPAGTRIVNVATVVYASSTGAVSRAQASADFIVGRVAGVDIEAPLVSTVLPGARAVFPHTLQNLGNAADTFDVLPEGPAGWPTTILHDVDGDGRVSAADTVITEGIALEMDETFALLVVVDVPDHIGQGLAERLTLEAVSRFDSSVTDVLVDGIRTADPQLQVTVNKTVDLTEAAEGELLTYSIAVRVDGSGQRDRILLTDTIPVGATYEPGTLRLDGTPLTDIEGDDAGRMDAARRLIEVDLTDIEDGRAVTVLFQVRIDIPSPTGTQIINRAHADVATPFGDLRGSSVNVITRVATPELQIRKTVTGSEEASVGDSLFYSIEVENPSTTLSASNLEIVDTLPADLFLRRAEPTPTQNGNVLSWTIESLAPGEIVRFGIVVEVGDVADSVTVVNQVNLLRNGVDDGTASSGPVTLTRGDTASLALELAAEVLEVQIGSTLPLRVDVANDGRVTVTDLAVHIVVPNGTEFIDQILQGQFTRLADLIAPAATDGPSAAPLESVFETNGGMQTDAIQLDSFRVQNDTLSVWIPGELRPGESFAFRYELLVGNGARGVLLNEASAEGRRGSVLAVARGRVVASNADEVPVVLERNRPLETRTVIGKVFVDANGNGRQDEGENGINGVDVWTEDGEISTTDSYGKFSFVNLRPGSHAFRLDPSALPLDLRIVGAGAEQGMKVVETNGWTSGRVNFPLVSRRARLADARVPQGASPDACTAFAARAGFDTAGCSPTGTLQQDLAATLLGLDAPETPVTAAADTTAADLAPALAPVTLASFDVDPTGWPEAAFPVPAGWSLLPGSGRVDGQVNEPAIRTAPNGQSWLVWEALPVDVSEITVFLAEGNDALERQVDLVRVDALRTDQERADEAAAAFITGTPVSIFAPFDGFVSATNRLYLGARGEAQSAVSLFRGDSLITATEFRPDGVQDFIGLELNEGPQTFRIQSVNAFGNTVTDSIRVHRSGTPATLVPEEATFSVIADGRTTARTRVRVLDAWGVPVVNEPLITLRMDAGRFIGPDEDPSSVGHQVRASEDGWAEIQLVGGREPGTALLLVSAQDAEADIELEILPTIRPLILTGLGRVSLGAGGRDFGAVTARGRLDEKTSLTLSYDSRRLDQGRDVFGNSSDPLEDGRYSIIGDASQQRSLSASRYNFAATVERGLDWARFGDVQTMDFAAGMELARYGRALPGAAARITTGDVVWNAFGASTTQALRQIQIRGSGTSGPFALDGGILPGTEQVRIEIRAAENPTRPVSEQVLTRFVDYQIDYEFGSLLLKQPLPSADPYGNPVFLVLSYEAERGGDRSAVFGVRASSNLGTFGSEYVDSIPVSASIIRDGQPGEEFTLGAFQAGVVQNGGARLTAEIAVADASSGTDIATRVDGALPLLNGRVSLGGTWTRVGDDFRNPGNIALQAGAEEVRASADVRLGTAVVTLAHEAQRFAQRGIERNRTTIGLTQLLRDDLNLEARFAGDGSATTGLEASSGAGEYKLTWLANDRVQLFGEVRDQLWSNGGLASAGSRVGAGASYALSRHLTLEGRQFRVAPTGGASSYNVSSIGVTSQMRVGTKAWSSYQLMGGADGKTNAAVVGLNHQFQVGSALRFQSMLERRVGVAGASPSDPILASPFERPEEDYLAASVGVELVPQNKPYRLSARAEAKDGTRLSSQIATLAGDVSFDGSLALLSRQQYVNQNQSVGGTDRVTQSRSSLWGLAFRPTGHDAFNVLFKFHWKDGVNPASAGILSRDGEERRMIGALEAIWAPTARVEIAGRLATRTTRADAPEIGGIDQVVRSETQFFGSHARYSMTDEVGLKFEARGMVTGTTDYTVWDIAPSLLLQPFNGLEIETGYRFGNLQDPDFAVKTGKGFFMTFGMRITEQTLPTAADFWRNRFGN